MSGHEHDMQYFQSPAERTVDGSPHSVSYVVSGAGSDVRAGEFDVLSDQVTIMEAIVMSRIYIYTVAHIHTCLIYAEQGTNALSLFVSSVSCNTATDNKCSFVRCNSYKNS